MCDMLRLPGGRAHSVRDSGALEAINVVLALGDGVLLVVLEAAAHALEEGCGAGRIQVVARAREVLHEEAAERVAGHLLGDGADGLVGVDRREEEGRRDLEASHFRVRQLPNREVGGALEGVAGNVGGVGVV